MLRSPVNGWCHATIGNLNISASYLEDYPYSIAEALIIALNKSYSATKTANNELLSYFVLDAEENGRYFVNLYLDYYTISDDIIDEEDACVIYRSEINSDYLRILSQEFIDDINDYYDEWVHWMYYDDDEDLLNERREDISRFMTELYKYSFTRQDGI